MGVAQLEERRLLLKIHLHSILVPLGKGIALGREDHVGRRSRNGEQPLLCLQIRHGRKQGPGVGVGRAVKDLPGCSHLYDLSGIHHADPVRHIGYNAQIMGNEDHGELLFSFDLLDLVQDLRLDGQPWWARHRS